MFYRLCLLVQDAYGMFSEVQLQCLDSAEDIEQYCKRWEGKFCCLAGMKILQRTTRGRWEQFEKNVLSAVAGRGDPTFNYLRGQYSLEQPNQALFN